MPTPLNADGEGTPVCCGASAPGAGGWGVGADPPPSPPSLASPSARLRPDAVPLGKRAPPAALLLNSESHADSAGRGTHRSVVLQQVGRVSAGG